MPTYTPPASSGGGGGGGSYADADAISAVEGESTLVLSSGVTVGTDLKLSTSSDHAIIENVTQDKDIIFHVNDGGSASTEVMRIDGSLSKVGIGTGNAISANLHVQGTGVSDTTPIMMVESTDSGSATAPDLVLYRNSSNAAATDAIGHLLFRGKNDNASPQDVTYAQIYSKIEDVSDGSEDGQLFLRTIVDGTLRNKIECNATEVVINNGSIDNDFRVEGDGDTHAIFVNGANDRVGIGTDAPTVKFEVSGDATISRSVDLGQTRTLIIEGARNATGTDYARIDLKNYDSHGPTSYVGARIAAVNEATGVDDGSLVFSTNNANAGLAEIMRLTDDGKVGIGLTAPSATLDILTGGTFRNTRLLTVSSSTNPLALTEAAHAGRYVIYNGSSGTVNLPATSTAGEHYAILNITGGNVTIGRNGRNINGAASDFTLATFKAATCIAIGSNNWMVVG